MKIIYVIIGIIGGVLGGMGMGGGTLLVPLLGLVKILQQAINLWLLKLKVKLKR